MQAAIDQFNAMTSGTDLRSAEELFKDWAIAVKLDDEDSDRWNFSNIDFGDPAFTAWTVDIANDEFCERPRPVHRPDAGGALGSTTTNVPDQTALPFGVSYETFRNLGS